MTIKIRSVLSGDLENIALFLSKNHGHIPEEWIKRFDMWYVKNPVGELDIPLGWVLESDDDEIKGFMGNIPVSFQVGESKSVAVASTSWVVVPEVRGIDSLKIYYAYYRQKNVRVLINTTPNEFACHLIERLGFHHIECPPKNTFYLCAIRIDPSAIFSFCQKKVSNKYLLTILKKLLHTRISNVGITIINTLFTPKSAKYLQDEYKSSVCDCCDPSFTALFENHRKPDVMTLWRDAETLNWLYFSDLVKDKRIVIQCNSRSGNALAGYVALDLIDSMSSPGKKSLILKDAFIPEINKNIVYSILSLCFEQAKRYDVDIIYLWPLNKEMEKILKNVSLFPVVMGSVYYYKGVNLDQDLINNLKFIPSLIDPDKGVL
jgi:hypothetical protein